MPCLLGEHTPPIREPFSQYRSKRVMRQISFMMIPNDYESWYFFPDLQSLMYTFEAISCEGQAKYKRKRNTNTNTSVKMRNVNHCSGKIWLMLTWYALAGLFFSFSGSARAASRNSATSNHNIFHGRGIQEIPVQIVEDENDNRKKDDEKKKEDKKKNEDKKKKEEKKKEDLVETDTPTQSPSQLTTDSPVTESPTESPTDSESSQPSATKQIVEDQLLSFSVTIHGSLSTEDEFHIRELLQDYLLNTFLEQEQVDVKTDSIVLEMVQMVESYIPLAETNVDNEEQNGNERSRNLGHQVQRHLLSASSTSTTSTRIEYQTSAIFLFEQEDKKDEINNALVMFQFTQIEALENTGKLQGYFLEWFASEQQLDQGLDVQTEDSQSEVDPVVLMAIEITERPPKFLDSKETWEAIESILDSSNTTDTIDTSSGIEDVSIVKEKETNGEEKTGDSARPVSPLFPEESDSASNNSNEERTSIWKIAVGIGCALMILVGFVVIFFVWRKKKRQYDSKFVFFSKGKKLSPVENRNDHPAEITNDVESVEHPKQNDAVNASKDPESSNDGVMDVANSSGATANNNAVVEEVSSKKSSFAFSPISLLRNSFKNKNQQLNGNRDDSNDVDSVEARMKLNDGTPNDDDSMMGYSLTSLNRDRNNERRQQDYSVEDLDTMSAASSEPDGYNPVFAGIHKYVAQTSMDGEGRRNDQEHRPRSLLGDDTVEFEQEESLMMPNILDSGKLDNVVTNEDAKFRQEEDIEAVALVSKSDGVIADDSKYYGQDEIMMTTKVKKSALTEKISSDSCIPPMQSIQNNSNGMVTNGVETDGASDAPSDERDHGPSIALPFQHSAGGTQSADAIRNSKVLDNDPAVLEYLVGDGRNNASDRSEGSPHQQPQLTVEL